MWIIYYIYRNNDNYIWDVAFLPPRNGGDLADRNDVNQSSRIEVERVARKSVIRSLLEILEEGSHVSFAGPQSVQRMRY